MHHPILYMFSRRTLTTPLLYHLRAKNLSLGTHLSLNPWGSRMRYPETTLWLILSLTLDMPLRGKHLVVSPITATTTLAFFNRKTASYYDRKGKV